MDQVAGSNGIEQSQTAGRDLWMKNVDCPLFQALYTCDSRIIFRTCLEVKMGDGNS